MINLGPSPDEQRLADLELKIRSLLRGHYKIGVFGKGEDRLYASGEIVWVYTDQRTHEAVRVSDALRARIASVDAVA